MKARSFIMLTHTDNGASRLQPAASVSGHCALCRSMPAWYRGHAEHVRVSKHSRLTQVAKPACGSLHADHHISFGTGRIVTSYECGAAVSASPAFDVAARRAYLACLDGSIHCLTVHGADGAAEQLALTLAWRQELNGPVFSDPIIAADGTLLVAAVDGAVSSLSRTGA